MLETEILYQSSLLKNARFVCRPFDYKAVFENVPAKVKVITINIIS